MNTRTKTSGARERILKKAEELFYSQGYQGTGINQIIKEAGVAKASFYAAFPSKEDLCVTYLRTLAEREEQDFARELAKRKSPLSRFLCTAEMMVPFLEESDFRGCAFLNMIPEVPGHDDPIRSEAARFYRNYEKLIAGLAGELIASDAERYGHLSASSLARDYMTLVAGGLSLAALHHSVEPMKHAVRIIRRLVEA